MEKYFGTLPSGPKPAAPAVQTRPIARQVRETLTDDVQLARIFVRVIAPPAWSDEGFAYDLAQEILAGGKTSRLYRALVFDRELVQEVDMATDKATFGSASRSGDGQARSPLRRGGGGARRRAGPARAHPALRCRASPRKRNIEARLYRGIERLNGNGSRADILNAMQMWRGDQGSSTRWSPATAR